MALIFVLFAADARARKDELPNYGNATVIAAPEGEVKAEATADGNATRLLFRHWDESNDRTVRLSILNAPLLYRAYPSRGARMAVEVFSDDHDVSFFSHREKAFMQILVGESLPDATVVDILTHRDFATRATGDAAQALQKRRFEDARNAFLAEPTTDEATALLRDARLGLLDLVLKGPREATCPTPYKSALDTETAREAAFLAASCLDAEHRPEAALAVLARIDPSESSPALAARVLEATRRIVIGRLLDADRRAKPILVASRFLRDRDLLVGGDEVDVSVFEALIDNLKRLGLAGLMTYVADRLALTAASKRQPASGGAIAETYLYSDQLLRASDAASYFLALEPAEWLEGRLLRVRGHASLQEGFWANAAADLDAARPLLYDFGPADLLGRAEARLRRGPIPIDPKAKKKPAAPAPAPSPAPLELPKREDLPGYLLPWLDLLEGRTALDEGRRPTDEQLDAQPAHVLYKAADAFAKRGDAKTAKELLERARNGEGGWAVLAGVDRDILALQKRLEAYRIIAEAKQ